MPLQAMFHGFHSSTQAGLARSISVFAFGVACTSVFAQVSGVGSGIFNYTVEGNTGPDSRIVHVTVADQVFTLTQAGCAYTLTASVATFGVGASSGSFGVSTDAQTCQWSATSSASWLIASGHGPGNGIVSFAASKNPGGVKNSRTASIIVANKSFAVVQK